MLSRLHDAHQGVDRTQMRARLTLYWPGIDSDIEAFVKGCRHCQERLPSLPQEPMILKPRPERPFQEIAADFANHAGHEYLITVDCYTDWPEIMPMTSTTAEATIKRFRGLFSRTAAPDRLWTDGGPQFASAKMQEFLNSWGVRHDVSSPHYPQSNGKAEATVKSMKKIIASAWTGKSMDLDKLCRSLLQYRNTPSKRDGRSPAQKLFGTPLQDTLPAHCRSFAPEWQRVIKEDSQEQAETTGNQAKRYYDERSQSLRNLEIGNHVAVQNPTSKMWDIHGKIVDIGPHRKYFVRTQRGRILTRNRRFLRKRIDIQTGGTQEHQPAVAQDPPPQQRRSGMHNATTAAPD